MQEAVSGSNKLQKTKLLQKHIKKKKIFNELTNRVIGGNRDFRNLTNLVRRIEKK